MSLLPSFDRPLARTARILLLPALAGVGSTSARAEDGLQLSGTSRIRYEVIDGQPRTGFNASDDLLNLRTTLAADYRKGGLRLFAELWDSRVYAEDAGTPVTTGEVNTLEPVQAFVSYEAPDAFGRGTRLAVQAGRFLTNVGSRRLVAADDYRNTTSGYSGVRVDATLSKTLSTTLIYTMPQVRLPDGRADIVKNRVKLDRESFDLVLWGGLVTQRLMSDGTKLDVTYFHLGERDRADLATRDRSLDTYGGRLYRDPAPGKADFELEGYAQTGTVSASLAPGAAQLSVAAWFAHAKAGYSLTGPWAPHVSLELDYASGDRPGGKYGRFDSLFGQRRGDFSPAGLVSAIQRTNFVSPAIRGEVTPSKRLDALATYRPMWLASRTDAFATTGARDASGRAGNFAGHQFDARVRYWLIPKRLRLEWDGTYIAKGRFLESAPNVTARGDMLYNSFNATVSF